MTEPNESTTELTNIAELFQKSEYKDKLVSMRELVKVADILDKPLIILGYKEDTMPDAYSNGEKDCFRMDFRFADDEAEIKHYIRTEARYLWEYLKTVNSINPELIKSGKLVAIICQGKKKSGKMSSPYYYFAGTMDPKSE